MKHYMAASHTALPAQAMLELCTQVTPKTKGPTLNAALAITCTRAWHSMVCQPLDWFYLGDGQAVAWTFKHSKQFRWKVCREAGSWVSGCSTDCLLVLCSKALWLCPREEAVISTSNYFCQ